MKRFLALAAALCSICILFSSCVFLPNVGTVLNEWNTILEDFLNDSYTDHWSSEDVDLPDFEQDDSIGDAYTVEDLEKKYGFSIEDPDGLLSDENGPSNCAIIDQTLEIYSKPLIKGFLKNLWRRDCSFSMEFVDEISESLGETSYTTNSIHIKIFAPRNSRDPSVTNGITVETIAHELGHAVHDALEYQYGADEIEDAWIELNGLYYYGDEWDSGCESYFSYEYGMTSYYEDVATVFEDLAAYPLVMSSRLSLEENTPLYMKAKLLYTMMNDTFDLSESHLFDAYETARSRRGDTLTYEESISQFDAFDYGYYEDAPSGNWLAA